MYYGLSNKRTILELSEMICACVGHGSHGFAVQMLVETCAAETLLGEARDNTLYGAGAGVAQVDEGTFDWLKDKYENHELAVKLKGELNVNLSKVKYNELDFSPLLSLIFARLRYWTTPATIPQTKPERAQYWKDHYNTSAGKGTPSEYMQRCISSGVQRFFNE